MQNPAWALVVIGVVIAVLGGIWLLVPSIPWLGKLLGDIIIERENFKFYFPLSMCITVSLLLTGIFWIIRMFVR